MRPAPLMLVALSALACAKEPAPASPPAQTAPQQVTITATDFGYQLPTTPVTAGLTTITLVNTGKELHQAQLYRLTEGKTFADFTAANQAGGPPPAWAVPEGGPNGALPGLSANATLVLQPGQYVLICRIPSPDGIAHMAKGMILGMEVQPASATPAALPAGDIQMALFDYGFSMSQPITAGTHTFTVTNQATQPHEVVVIQVPPGGSMDAWKGWLSGGMKGPPPGAPISGLTDLAPGASQNFTATFSPGTYGLICFVPDAKDGQPHLFHGMLTQFTVS
jgi:uncharacterized cupredoxin-like copper-binding protein